MLLYLFSLINWEAIRSESFIVVYPKGYKYQAEEVIKNLEYYKDKVHKLTGNKRKYTYIVIEDIGVVPNGFAEPMKQDIHIFTTPPPPLLIGSMENWFRGVSVHEYTHICHLTNTGGIATTLNTICGNIFQPNMYTPGWIIEGITVYTESQLSPYEGRLNDGFFDAYIKRRAMEEKMPSIMEATYSPLEYPGGSGIYLFGGKFFDYLSKKYGEEKFAKVFDEIGEDWEAETKMIWPAIGIDKAFRKVYGRSLEKLWEDWKEKEEKRERGKKFYTNVKKISKIGWELKYVVEEGGKLYYYKSYPRKYDCFDVHWFNEVWEIDLGRGKERKILSTTAPIEGGMKVKNGNLYYGIYEFVKGYSNSAMLQHGIVIEIYKMKIKTKKKKFLFKENLRCFCVLEDGSILYTKDKKTTFGSEVWIYRDGKKKFLFSTTRYLIGELEANGNCLVAVAKEKYSNWSLYELNLETRNKLSPLVATPWVECAPVIKEGEVIFTANFDKKYNIYSYDLKTKKIYQLVNTNYATYGVVYQGDVIFVGIERKGFSLYKKRMNKKEVKIKNYPHSSTPNFTQINIERGIGEVEKLISLIKPYIHIPLIFPTDTTGEKWALGGFVRGRDVTWENQYIGFAYKDPYLNETQYLGAFLTSEFAPFYLGLVGSKLTEEIFFESQKQIESDSLYFIEDVLGLIFWPMRVKIGKSLSYVGMELIYSHRTKIYYKTRQCYYGGKNIAPGIRLGINYPTWGGIINMNVPVESKKIGSREDKIGKYFSMKVWKYLRYGMLSIKGNAHSTPVLPQGGYLLLRGYAPYEVEQGGSVSFEYSLPIYKIRRGWWNPNVYFGDVIITPFVDIGIDVGKTFLTQDMNLLLKEIKYSVGGEFKLELSAAFNYFNIGLCVVVAYTKEGEAVKYVQLLL